MAGLVGMEIWAWDGLYVKGNIANLIPLTVFWVLWKEKNSRVFDGVESSVYKIRDR